MSEKDFLETAVKNLPGGLILVDLQGRLRAVNETAELLLNLEGPTTPGIECEIALANHPKIVKVLKDTLQKMEGSNRQELVTQRADGEKMVLGYGTLILRGSGGKPAGIGLTFQDITRMIPLMDSHRFLDIALKNLPGGLIFVDLNGKVRGVNQTALKLLGMTEEVEPGTECHKAFIQHPHLYKVLLSTCENLKAVNRQEITTHRGDGEKVTLGYGTLILRNPQGQPVGIGMTFQDITRFIPLPLKAEFIRVVDRFFTPFALILVLSALLLGFAESQAKMASISLVCFLGIFNEVSAWMARKHSEWAVRIGNTRLITNFLANVLLVYLLGTFWGPMWLLFVLTPVATALHADSKKTIITAMISAGTLLGIYAARGLSGQVGWGMASLHAMFIVFLSLFVNSIARLVMQMKSSSPAARPDANVIVSPARTAAKNEKLAA